MDFIPRKNGTVFLGKHDSSIKKKKVPLLVIYVGEHAYKILKIFRDPIKPAEDTYDKLYSEIGNRFAPKISVFRKREKFFGRRQTAKESVNKWCYENKLRKILK